MVSTVFNKNLITNNMVKSYKHENSSLNCKPSNNQIRCIHSTSPEEEQEINSTSPEEGQKLNNLINRLEEEKKNSS